LAARYAEYTGWMAQESGSEKSALWWTQRAVQMASAAGDNDLVGYAAVREALITLYGERSRDTVELAQRAQQQLPPRLRSLASQREAQGHALAGDYDACMRSLDRARIFASRNDDEH